MEKDNISNKNDDLEKEKIHIAHKAFRKFRVKIEELIKRQNQLFQNIMRMIDNKEIDKLREKIDDLYEEDDKNENYKNKKE